MRDPLSGDSSIVAAPRTPIFHPAGAMNVLPATVVRGVSAARTSLVPACEDLVESAEHPGGMRATARKTKRLAGRMGERYLTCSRQSSRSMARQTDSRRSTCVGGVAGQVSIILGPKRVASL